MLTMIESIQLNRQIVVKSKDTSTDALNFPSHDGTYTNVATLYAKEVKAIGSSKYENNQNVSIEKRAFVIRRNTNLSITQDMVFEIDGKDYEITRLNDYKGSLEFKVIEGVYRDNG